MSSISIIVLLRARLSRQIIQEILPARSLNQLWVVLWLEVMRGDDVARVVFAGGGEKILARALLVDGSHGGADFIETVGELLLQVGDAEDVAQALRPFGELAAKLRDSFEIDDDRALGAEPEIALV